MPSDITRWLETRRIHLPPVPDDSIVGLAHSLAALRSVAARLRDPASGTTLPRGILLAGPSGTGKTLSARWLAGEAGSVPVFDLPPDTLTPGRVRRAFAHLAREERCIVFLPEIDAIGLGRDWGHHDQGSRRTLFALLEALDGLVPIAPGRGPVVIATSNRYARALDSALARRLAVTILFETPDTADRQRLLAFFVRDRPHAGLDLVHLAELTRGWTPAALRGMVDEAHGYALDRGGSTEPITEADALLAVRRAGVREKEPDADDPPAQLNRWRSAVHEAGHALVACRLGIAVRSIRLAASGLEGRTETGTEGMAADDREIRANVVIALAGSAAERTLLGEPSTGSVSDVRGATRMLLDRIGAGIDPAFPPIDRMAFGDFAPRVVDDLITEHVLGILERAREEAATLVAAERDAIERLARLLLDRPVLAGDALADALGRAGARPSHPAMEENPDGPALPAAPALASGSRA